MNKQSFLLILCSLFLANVHLFSQKQTSNGEINYEVTIKINQEKNNAFNENSKASKKVKEQVNSLLQNARKGKANFKLRFDNKKSIFKEDKTLKIEDREIDFIKILIGKGVFYTDKTANKIVLQKESFGELFLINIPKVEWHLTQEIKKIGKYTCYKATSEKEVENRRGKHLKKITAWYTPELPISYGPKNYSGLPGLILELEEGELLYRASKINLSPKKNTQIKEPTKGKKMTLKEYNRAIKKLITDFKR